jgi:hypothetical protein
MMDPFFTNGICWESGKFYFFGGGHHIPQCNCPYREKEIRKKAAERRKRDNLRRTKKENTEEVSYSGALLLVTEYSSESFSGKSRCRFLSGIFQKRKLKGEILF